MVSDIYNVTYLLKVWNEVVEMPVSSPYKWQTGVNTAAAEQNCSLESKGVFVAYNKKNVAVNKYVLLKLPVPVLSAALRKLYTSSLKGRRTLEGFESTCSQIN